MKVLANDGISQAGIDALEAAGYTVLTDKVEQSDLIDTINKENIEVLIKLLSPFAQKRRK